MGCDDAEEDGLAVGTYNAGLAPGYVPLSVERAPVTLEALADQPIDVVCVQEVWGAGDMDMLRNLSGDRWPNVIVPAADPGTVTGTTPACDAPALTPIQGCAADACADVGADALAGCVLASCQTELAALPVDCNRCLAVNIGAPLDAILESCTTTPGELFAFDGSFGIGLFSRYPLLDQDFLLFDSSLIRRGVIYARIEAPNVGDVDVFCTHLSPVFEDIPFPGTGSWEAEQRAQVEALLDFVAEKTGGEGRTVLLGDLNTGPVGTGIEPVAPENYALLLEAFRNPYIEDTEVPLCTFCSTNPLVDDSSPSSIIDHVLVRGLSADGTTTRFMTGTTQVDVDGTTVETSFSDHYGLRASLIE